MRRCMLAARDRWMFTGGRQRRPIRHAERATDGKYRQTCHIGIAMSDESLASVVSLVSVIHEVTFDRHVVGHFCRGAVPRAP